MSTVSIGGSAATVLYAGLAPGLQGIYQLNIAPPAQISMGNALTGTLPADGQFSLPGTQMNFGGFVNIAHSPGTYTAMFELYVDNLLVASTSAPFTIQ